MYQFERRIRYYETDKMGVTHHSNYIRMMEEARVEWMDSIGWSYKKCEDMGLGSPVLSVNCQYKKATTFDDILLISIWLKKYNGFLFAFEYEMKRGNEIVSIGESEHCFLNERGRPVIIKKNYPEIDKTLNEELCKLETPQLSEKDPPVIPLKIHIADENRFSYSFNESE